MKKLIYLCSLIALLLSACDKHADIVLPTPCVVTSFVQTGILCPDVIGEDIEVWFEATFECADPTNVTISINPNGHNATYTVLQQQTTNGITKIYYKSNIIPLSGSSSAAVSYSLTYNGTEKHFTVTCDLPDEPEECELQQINLVQKVCPDEVGEPIQVWFDVVYKCSTIPVLTLDVDENGHTVSTNLINVEQVGNQWIRHMKSTITPAVGATNVSVDYTVTFEGTTKTLSVNCNLPDPDHCELYDLRIVNEKWLSEEQVEVSLEVWFENCNLIPTFNIVGTNNADFTIEHTGSYTQGGFAIYKIKSIVTTVHCQESVFVHYSVTYENVTKVASFETELCQFKEVRNKIVQYPYQNDATQAAVYFDLVFIGCHGDPLYNVAITDDIPNEQISLEVLSVTHSGDETIFHMFSIIDSPNTLYNNWVTYDISYCAKGAKITVDF